MATFPEKETFEGHPSMDTTSRFPLDRKLRKYGFKILSRKGMSSPLWIKHGKVYSQEEALEEVSGGVSSCNSSLQKG